MSAHAHAHAPQAPDSLNRTALAATLHCLTGCAIGEVLGIVIGTALGWGNAATIALAVTLAFVFGYSLTMAPLLRAGLALSVALPLAFASDSLSIAVMELTDNGIMLAVPGAMDAGLTSRLFWASLAVALVVAFAVAFPLNRYLIARGRGHAVVHGHHGRASQLPSGSPSRAFTLIGVAAVTATLAITVAAALLLEGEEKHASVTVTDTHLSAGLRPAVSDRVGNVTPWARFHSTQGWATGVLAPTVRGTPAAERKPDERQHT